MCSVPTEEQSLEEKRMSNVSAYCLKRFEVELAPHHCKDLMEFGDCPEKFAARIKVSLNHMGYFKPSGKAPQNARLTCLLHWPWPSGIKMDGSDLKEVRRELGRTPIVRQPSIGRLNGNSPPTVRNAFGELVPVAGDSGRLASFLK